MTAQAEPRFGEQRLVRPDVGAAERLLFRFMGVADPAHYLHSLMLRRGLSELGDLRPSRVLDAGCGAGDYTFYLARRYPDATVLGVDINEALIRRNRDTAQRLGFANVGFEVADLATARFESPFDLIVSIDVLEHIVAQGAALANLSAALRPGGVAFFHIPTVRERPVPFSRWLHGFHAWAAEEHVAEERTADEFVSSVRGAGFEIVSARRTFGYFTGELATSLFALPFSDRLHNRVLQGLLAPVCRVLARADVLGIERTRYAVAVAARKPAAAHAALG